MTPRYTRRPPKKRVGKARRSSSGSGKSGACSFAIPAAACALLVLLSQAALVRWQIEGAK